MLGSRDAGTGSGKRAGGAETRLGPALVIWWQRASGTSARFAAASALVSFMSFSSFRAYTLLAILLLVLVVMVTIRDILRSRSTGAHLWCSMTTSWELIDSSQNNQSGTGPQLSDALKLFLQETSTFKQQHPGKFCLLVCSLCTFFAVLGRYIPGIVISYFLVLGVFLWPLISSREVGLWLDPVLQKLDFGIGEFVQKIKENHEKRLLQRQTEKEAIESDLSSMFPKLDSTVCKEMSISDTEASDVTWTDNGTFNLSEGHTPQTENSDDLDKEEAFAGGLPEFPSLDNGSLTNGDDDDDFSLGLLSPSPHLQQPPACKRQASDKALELVNQMASDAIAAAVTAAIQERIEAAAGVTGQSALPECTRLSPLDPTAESDSEVEDFELLDQSELDHLEEKLELGEQAKTDTESSAGFFYKILKRR